MSLGYEDDAWGKRAACRVLAPQVVVFNTKTSMRIGLWAQPAFHTSL